MSVAGRMPIHNDRRCGLAHEPAAERAQVSAPLGSAFGAPLRRREDPRLLTGRGEFLDDVRLPGMLYGRFVRSEHAHARVLEVDAGLARRQHDVVAVFTAEDVAGRAATIPLIRKPPAESGEPPVIPLLASGTVRFVGEPLALVVATSPESARDGADLVRVEYEPLEAVPELETAVGEGAAAVHDAFPDNVAFRVRIGEGADALFDQADVVVPARLRNTRVVPTPLEPRGMVARWDVVREHLDVWITTQRPHHTRWFVGEVLGIPEHRIRVRAGDVGGAFGAKEPMYPDEGAVAFAARELGRPVKWMEDRSESFLATTHGRDQVADLEVAASRDGRILAVRGRVDANMGAYLYPNSPGTVIGRTGPLLPQSYDIQGVDLEIRGIYTTTTPVGPYRGAGRPEATYYMERLVDLLAAELGDDPAELRRRNFVQPDQFPYRTASGLTYDSGDYAAALDVALREVGYERLQADRGTDERTIVGVGVASYVEIGGVTPSSVARRLEGSPGLWETAELRVHPSGRVEVGVGTCAHGQGHETAFAQVAADVLDVPYDDVVVRFGDTATGPFGFGTFGSRSGAVGGAAVREAASRVRDKAHGIAARMLDRDPGDVEHRDGAFQDRDGEGRKITFAEVAAAAVFDHTVLGEGEEPGLDATARFDPPDYTFSSGTHACVVEVDRETGRVRIRRYVAVDDCGTVINPVIVDGQVHGGVAQGIGQALFEHARYDDRGQPLTGTLMDYAVPGATQLPRIETHRVETPSPVNPLGVKGAGESGSIVATPAVANAVNDALSQAGAGPLDLPLTAPRVWHALTD